MKLLLMHAVIILIVSQTLFAMTPMEREACVRSLSGVAVENSYAQKFHIYQTSRGVLLGVVSNQGEDLFLLVKESGVKLPIACQKVVQIAAPLKRTISLSSSHLPWYEALGEENSLKGVGQFRYVYSPKILQLRKLGRVKEVGYPPHPERVLALKPQLVFAFHVSSKEVEGTKRLEGLKIPVIYINEFLEEHPLARAEWVIFFAHFYNKVGKAKDFFQTIVENYLKWSTLANKQKEKISVGVGENRQGTWSSPGVQSDLAIMLKDAGLNYVWKKGRGRNPIQLKVEEAYQMMNGVDIWLTHNHWSSLRQLVKENPRFKDLKVVKQKRVFNFNRRLSALGANDYWERGVSRPDLLLKDLVKLCYPSLLVEHTLTWYQKLE